MEHVEVPHFFRDPACSLGFGGFTPNESLRRELLRHLRDPPRPVGVARHPSGERLARGAALGPVTLDVADDLVGRHAASANGRILWKLPDGRNYADWESSQGMSDCASE